MSKNTNQLPYFKVKQKLAEKNTADFMLGKFKPRIKERFPGHYLIQPIPHKTLESIEERSRKYPYFLRFDIRLYYPSVNHEILLKKLPEIYQKIAGKPISRRSKKHLCTYLDGLVLHYNNRRNDREWFSRLVGALLPSSK